MLDNNPPRGRLKGLLYGLWVFYTVAVTAMSGFGLTFVDVYHYFFPVRALISFNCENGETFASMDDELRNVDSVIAIERPYDRIEAHAFNPANLLQSVLVTEGFSGVLDQRDPYVLCLLHNTTASYVANVSADTTISNGSSQNAGDSVPYPALDLAPNETKRIIIVNTSSDAIPVLVNKEKRADRYIVKPDMCTMPVVPAPAPPGQISAYAPIRLALTPCSGKQVP